MMELVGLLAAVVLGVQFVRWADPVGGLRSRWAARLLEVGLGTGAGAALAALWFLLLLATGVANRWVLLGGELAGIGVLTWLGKRRGAAGAGGVADEPPRGWRWNWILALALGLTLLLVAAAHVDTARLNPNGEFDAFAIWNARAEFLLGGGDIWQRAWSPLLIRQHPGYPLLLSAFVAGAWRAGGDAASPVAPFGAAMLFFYAGVLGTLVSSLALWRGLSAALLGCLVLIANFSFLQQSTWQYADIPLALYFLGSFVLLFLSERTAGRSRTAALALSGAFASFGAMTKNEGIPFLLLLAGCYTIVRWRAVGWAAAWKTIRIWALGALPGALLQAGFKIFLAPSGGSFAGLSLSESLAFLGDPKRYVVLASYLLSKLAELGSGVTHPLVLLLILTVTLRLRIDGRMKPLLLTSGAVMTLQLAVYCGVYLTTLDVLEWRLGTSLHRLYSQLWPLFVFVVFLILAAPQDAEEVLPERGSVARKKKKKR